MSRFGISSSYPVPTVMSRTEFENILKNLEPNSDLINTAHMQVSGTTKLELKLADLAGNGLSDSGDTLVVQAVASGGIDVGASGISVDVDDFIDDTTIEKNGSGNLQVKAGSIDGSHIADGTVVAAEIGSNAVGIDELNQGTGLEDDGTGKVRVALTQTGLTSITSTAFVGALTGNASTATTSTNVTVADTTDTTCFVSLFESATGDLAPKTDGSLSYNAATGALTATSFVGDLSGNASTVTNGVYTTSKISALAATTSAELKGVISDETGSGSLVFAESPTLVTPVLGTPASGNLTNCTFPTLNQDTTGTAATVTGATQAAITTAANLVTVGTIGTGEWQGTAIATNKGGTGLTAIGTAGQVLATNSGASGLEWVTTLPTNITSPADNTFLVYDTDANEWIDRPLLDSDSGLSYGDAGLKLDATVISVDSSKNVVINSGLNDQDFTVKGDTDASLLFVDASSDTIGMGGSADTSGTYTLQVHGQMKITGNLGTELVVQDSVNVAAQITSGTTGATQYIRSTGGDAQVYLDTDITDSSTNNSFGIRNIGASTKFVISDYNTTDNSYEEEMAVMSIDHATAKITLSNIPTSNSGLTTGQIYRDGSGADAALKIK